MLLGTGGGQVAGNVLGLTRRRGALVVDTGYPQYVPKYREAIARLSGGAITHAINTHWHDDHSEGNKVLGPDGTLIVAHANARTMLTRDNKINVVRTILDQPAFPPAALPVVTFDDRIELYFGGERIELVHVSPAHTAGDVVVILRDHNVVHMGDVFLSAAYPFADVDNGGDFDGVIEFCRACSGASTATRSSCPGHGRAARYDELERYVEMLVDRARPHRRADRRRRDARASRRRAADERVGREVRQPDDVLPRPRLQEPQAVSEPQSGRIDPSPARAALRLAAASPGTRARLPAADPSSAHATRRCSSETNFSGSSRLDAVIIMTPGITAAAPRSASRTRGKTAA